MLFFCEKREGKNPICKILKVTHFIDDRLEVLGYLETVENKFLFNPDDAEVRRHQQHSNSVVRIPNWNELVQKIKSTL